MKYVIFILFLLNSCVTEIYSRSRIHSLHKGYITNVLVSNGTSELNEYVVFENDQIGYVQKNILIKFESIKNAGLIMRSKLIGDSLYICYQGESNFPNFINNNHFLKMIVKPCGSADDLLLSQQSNSWEQIDEVFR